MTDVNVENLILDIINNPKRVRSDAGEFEKYDLDDVINALTFLKKQKSVSAKEGVQITRLVPGGPTD